MRLKEIEKESIINSIKEADPDAKIWLFGSRVDDNKKGGDIDIAILSNILHNNIMQIIKVKRSIFNKIGEQQIDIVTSKNAQEAIFKIAMAEGIELT